MGTRDAPKRSGGKVAEGDRVATRKRPRENGEAARVEDATGMDFFKTLPKEDQERLESALDLQAWGCWPH